MNRYRRHIFFLVLLVCVTVLVLSPAFQIFRQTRGSWRGVIPEYPKDATFYLARMAEVGRGHIFIGNPYIREYRTAPALSFFVADWLAAAPLLLGASLTTTVLWNAVFWSLLFCVIGYLLFLKLKLIPWQSAVATLFSFVQVYWLMLRPVAMQTVFPLYLLFLLAYLLWFKAPKSKKRIFFLAATSAATFYIYTYLWQIVVISFGVTYAYLLMKRRWSAICGLAISNAATAVLAIPMLAYTIKQASSEFYWETLIRVNLVFTRLPTMEVYYYGRWVVVAMLLCLVFRLRKPSQEDVGRERTLFAIVGITGIALLIASASNIVLNKEVDTATHIGRFITLWFSIVFCTLLVSFWSNIGKNQGIRRIYKIGVGLLLFAVFVGYARNALRAMAFSNVVESDIVAMQDYAIPLNWLEKNASPEQVVWILNQKISTYLPMLTHNYTLFHINAASYLMPSVEVQERYLVSHYFDNPSLADMQRLVSEYSGAGVRSQSLAQNRWVWFCGILSLEKIGYQCGINETETSIKGAAYYEKLYDRYLHQVVPNINAELEKFHVSYLVIDRKSDQLKRPLGNIRGLTLVYRDARFEIYALNRK